MPDEAPVMRTLLPVNPLWRIAVGDAAKARRACHPAGIRLRRFPNGWQLRGFYGKYYQPPPLVLHGERDTESQVGLAIPLAGWVLDVDHFRTSARDFFDHNPIGSSDIFLPLTITGALIRGSELTLRSPRFFNGLRVHIAYSNQTAQGFGTVSGGLTDFSPPGGYYGLDHDPRNTLNAGVEADLPGQAYASCNLYSGSGFSNADAPPSHLSSYVTLDATIGKSFGSDLRVSLTVLNLTDRHLLIDNSLTFDGMHYNAPRPI